MLTKSTRSGLVGRIFLCCFVEKYKIRTPFWSKIEKKLKIFRKWGKNCFFSVKYVFFKKLQLPYLLNKRAHSELLGRVFLCSFMEIYKIRTPSSPKIEKN